MSNLKWQSNAGMFGWQHNYWFAACGDRVFHIKRLDDGRAVLLVGAQFHAIGSGVTGSMFSSLLMAENAAQAIVDRRIER